MGAINNVQVWSTSSSSTSGLAVASDTYGRVWAAAGKAAMTDAEAASPLAVRPCDLRQTCVTRWLNAGVVETDVPRSTDGPQTAEDREEQ